MTIPAWLALIATMMAHTNTAPPKVTAFVNGISGKPTTVICENLVATADRGGETFITDTPTVILDRKVCLGVMLWRSPQRWLDSFEKTHPSVQVNYLVATGVVTAAHEGVHASGVRDETDTQCAAMRAARGLLGPVGWSYALFQDVRLPAIYHTHPC